MVSLNRFHSFYPKQSHQCVLLNSGTIIQRSVLVCSTFLSTVLGGSVGFSTWVIKHSYISKKILNFFLKKRKIQCRITLLQ